MLPVTGAVAELYTVSDTVNLIIQLGYFLFKFEEVFFVFVFECLNE